MILTSVRHTIQKYNLINKGEKIVVGVSGGPDSVALLYLLKSLSSELKLSLYVAHFDHMLRSDSHKDREFVKGLAAKLKLPFFTRQADINKIAKQGGSIEEIARNARMKFFFEVAKEVKARKIALGHNLDDQAETVLMRILRGAGLYGLSGILPKREISGFEIIRPLIKIRRRQIEAYLKKRRIATKMDASNLEDIYFRNKLRNRLIPLLENEYNKNIKEVLANMAENVGVDYDYLIRQAKKAKKNTDTKLNLKGFLKLHPAIQRLLIRMCIAKTQGDTRRINFQHIREIEDLIFTRPLNSVVDLPKGISVIKKKFFLIFYVKERA